MKPVYTQLKSVKHSVSNVPFPSVALCPVNKISKKAAARYAEELSTRTTEYSLDWFFKNIKWLGRMLDLDLLGYEEYAQFQKVLDRIDVDESTGRYNSQEILREKVINGTAQPTWMHTIPTGDIGSTAVPPLRRFSSKVPVGGRGSELQGHFRVSQDE